MTPVDGHMIHGNYEALRLAIKIQKERMAIWKKGG